MVEIITDLSRSVATKISLVSYHRSATTWSTILVNTTMCLMVYIGSSRILIEPFYSIFLVKPQPKTICLGHCSSAPKVHSFFLTTRVGSVPWLVWLNGLSTSPRTGRSQIQFPGRAHAWAVGQVPRQPINVSLPLFLPPFLSL